MRSKGGFIKGLASIAIMLPAAVIASPQQGTYSGSTPAVSKSPARPALNSAPITPELARTLKNHHADPSSRISQKNLGQLKQLWSFPTPHPVSHVPLVDKNRVFFADWGGTVYAVDAATGKKLWENKVEKPKTMWPWHGFAGTGALAGDVLVEASTEGTAFGLGARTGKLLWKTRIADDQEAGNISKLMAANNLVYIGLSSVEEPMTVMKKGFKPDFRGKVLALDPRTGRTVWERQLVYAPKNGVAVWSSFALDPETNVLYFTTGNNYTGEASELSDSLVAVNGLTGEILWHRQTTQHDVWTMADKQGPDYDYGAGPQLFEAVIGGRPMKLVGAGQKSGIFYAWDRTTGEPVWQTVIGYGGIDGGVHGEASVGSDRLIVWSNNNYLHTEDPTKHPLTIKAIDPATGRHHWVNNKAQPALLHAAGFLANDVYFLGALDGKVRAYGAADGKQLWSAQSLGPIGTSVWVDGERVFASSAATKFFGKWVSGKSGVTAFGIKP